MCKCVDDRTKREMGLACLERGRCSRMGAHKICKSFAGILCSIFVNNARKASLFVTLNFDSSAYLHSIRGSFNVKFIS